MKKFYLIFFLFFALPLYVQAQTGVSFVYINGSNIKDEKIKKWYYKGIQKFHPQMKNSFEQNSFTKKHLLKCGKYFVEEKPVIFTWGDNHPDKQSETKENSVLSKGLVTWLACRIRSTAKNVLHDIIWVQDYHNMNLVLDKLHKTVKTEIQKGNKVLLYGYSSGSFIAYDYILTRIPYLNVAELFNSINLTREQRCFASQHPMKNTCMSALEKNLAIFSAEGQPIIDKDLASFEQNYMNLDKETDSVCIPNNAVIGVVDIASPLVLFNSDLSDPSFKLTYYNRRLYKYILEDDMFWVTVNYREDALSFPSGRNLSAKEIENITNLDIEPCGGFIYDQSNTRGGIFAITHLHYLSASKKLSKEVVKAYVNGYRYQYGCRSN